MSRFYRKKAIPTCSLCNKPIYNFQRIGQKYCKKCNNLKQVMRGKLPCSC
jgi:hypothetical protein